LKQSHERQKGELKARDKELAALNLSKEDLNKHLQSTAQENEAAKQKIKALEVNFQLHFVDRLNMIRL
jgi:chromosome segregation ATPase